MSQIILQQALKWCHSLLCLAYPPVCLQCRHPLEEGLELLCSECLIQLEWLSPQKRCPYCFSSDFNPQQKICARCRKREKFVDGCAATFEYNGTATTLARHFKYSNKPYLASSLASLMTLQFLQLGWPKPDVIVPVPIALTKFISRGYNQSQLLAQELAKTLSSQVVNPLKRKIGGYSQARLTREEREQLSGDHFSLKKKVDLTDKIILLVDDVMTTGSTLRCCADRLLEGFPSKVYALSLCRAEETH